MNKQFLLDRMWTLDLRTAPVFSFSPCACPFQIIVKRCGRRKNTPYFIGRASPAHLLYQEEADSEGSLIRKGKASKIPLLYLLNDSV
jgi:hypothetical protein